MANEGTAGEVREMQGEEVEHEIRSALNAYVGFRYRIATNCPCCGEVGCEGWAYRRECQALPTRAAVLRDVPGLDDQADGFK